MEAEDGYFQHEMEIINMVIAKNNICLWEIQRIVIEDQGIFQSIDAVSISTTDCILGWNKMRMKQAYYVPFERNSDRVKDQHLEYVQIWFFILYHIF